jgi:hypothetical protein
VDKERSEKHGKIVHALNDHEAVVWDATDISPEVSERFARTLARRVVANNRVLKKLGLAMDNTPELDGPAA